MRKLSLLALAAVAAPASAQEPPDGQGFRVEAIAGYDSLGVEGKAAHGVSYGLGLGYDFRIGGAVAGVEAEASDSSTDECFQNIGLHDLWGCVAGGRDLYAGGRVGAVVGGRAILYVKAGYANSRVVLDPAVSAAISPPIVFRRNLDGVRAGAGIEFGLGSRVFVKTEYRYTNYEDGFDRHQVIGGVGLRF